MLESVSLLIVYTDSDSSKHSFTLPRTVYAYVNEIEKHDSELQWYCNNKVYQVKIISYAKHYNNTINSSSP